MDEAVDTADSTGSEQPQSLDTAPGTPGWRKRHPRLSRLLLYGLASVLALFIVGGVLYHRRVSYAESRLDKLDLVLSQDPLGDETLRILDEEFSAPWLPRHIRQQVERARAFALLRKGDADEALSALDRAAALAEDDRDREAIRIERGQVLIGLDRAEEALAALEAEVPASEHVLSLWRGLAFADALRTLERPEEGLQALEAALASRPRPLPDGPSLVLALTSWKPADAAYQATVALGRWPDVPDGTDRGEPWLRLAGLAPDDVSALLEAAARLTDLDRLEEASEILARARAVDPVRAARRVETDPALKRLAEISSEPLKPEVPPGR